MARGNLLRPGCRSIDNQQFDSTPPNMAEMRAFFALARTTSEYV